MSQSDEQLVTGYLAGDDRCFAMLIRRHQESLLRLMTRVTGDAAMAEDVAQEALLAAACSLDSLEEPGKFRSWLFRIAYRKGSRVMNQRSLTPATLSMSDHPELEPASAAPESSRHESPIREKFRRVVSSLKGPDRALLDLRFIDGFSCAEIAGIIGEQADAVRQRIWRIKQSLLARLDVPDGSAP